MAFQVSPGVNTSEIDLTNVVVAAGTSAGGIAGRFNWGPIEEIKLVTDQDTLVEMGMIDDDNCKLIPNSGEIEFIPVEDFEDRKLIFELSKYKKDDNGKPC